MEYQEFCAKLNLLRCGSVSCARPDNLIALGERVRARRGKRENVAQTSATGCAFFSPRRFRRRRRRRAFVRAAGTSTLFACSQLRRKQSMNMGFAHFVHTDYQRRRYSILFIYSRQLTLR